MFHAAILFSISTLGICFSFIFVEAVERMIEKKSANRVSEDDSFWNGLRGFVFFSIVVLAIWLGAFFAMPALYDEPGSAGDMFGSVTSLFSGLAFAGLISTLLMQRSELKLQRQELGLSRDEFRRQRFENTLFGLIELFNGHIGSLEQPRTGRPFGSYVMKDTVRGREVLRQYAEMLPDELYVERGESDGVGGYANHAWKVRSMTSQIRKYERLYNEKLEADLGPYFRLLYNALRHIEVSDLSKNEKLRYSKILRAYLSSSEIKLLMFNCASSHGRGMKNWVILHRMLKHIHPETVRLNVELAKSYPKQAFDCRSRVIEEIQLGLTVPTEPPTLF